MKFKVRFFVGNTLITPETYVLFVLYSQIDSESIRRTIEACSKEKIPLPDELPEKVIRALPKKNQERIRNMKKKISFEQDALGTLCICAIRYCMGRETYMPDLVREIVRPLLPSLSDKDISVMLDDCDFQARCDMYGDEQIDKPGWIKWRVELVDEINNRREDKKGSEIL